MIPQMVYNNQSFGIARLSDEEEEIDTNIISIQFSILKDSQQNMVIDKKEYIFDERILNDSIAKRSALAPLKIYIF